MAKTAELDSVDAILEAAEEDGFRVTREQAAQILAARRKGALLWTREHICTTDASRLSIRPDR